MLFWVVLLVFGVPAVAVVMQSIRSSKARNDRLDQIQKRLAEKQQEAIDSKLTDMKEKSQKR